MELYTRVSNELSRHLTHRYSTSFSTSSLFFSKDIRPDIYAIYGLVRVADEIVDTYCGSDAGELLDLLEQDTERAMKTGFSANPIVHSFAVTAKQYSISTDLTKPFFKSMRMDLLPQSYSTELYNEYIYGSAEVIGLMCLRVFTGGDQAQYDKLCDGAQSLGAAYQKVNFLRDMYSDFEELGRVYFPGVSIDTFSDEQKKSIEDDIQADFTAAKKSLATLPRNSRTALRMSYDYYYGLFQKIKLRSIDDLKNTRVRLPTSQKVFLYVKRALLR